MRTDEMIFIFYLVFVRGDGLFSQCCSFRSR
jgi:hypothetical protein